MPFNGPFARVFAPILLPSSNATVVGLASVDFVFSAVLDSALPDNADYLDAVLVSKSGITYTFHIDDGTVASWAQGDAHDARFGSLGRSITSTVGHTSYMLTLYPTTALRDAFVTNARVVTTAGAKPLFLTLLRALPPTM